MLNTQVFAGRWKVYLLERTQSGALKCIRLLTPLKTHFWMRRRTLSGICDFFVDVFLFACDCLRCVLRGGRGFVNCTVSTVANCWIYHDSIQAYTGAIHNPPTRRRKKMQKACGALSCSYSKFMVSLKTL